MEVECWKSFNIRQQKKQVKMWHLAEIIENVRGVLREKNENGWDSLMVQFHIPF